MHAVCNFWQFFHLKMELVAWVLRIESSNDTSVRSMRNKTWWHCTLIGMPEHFDSGRCYGVKVFSMFGWQHDSRWSCDFLKKQLSLLWEGFSAKKSISLPVATENSRKKMKLLISIPDKFEFLLWFWHTPSFGKSFPIGNFQFLPMTSLITNRKSPKNLGW